MRVPTAAAADGFRPKEDGHSTSSEVALRVEAPGEERTRQKTSSPGTSTMRVKITGRIATDGNRREIDVTQKPILVRVQLSRKAGWRMPENTVKVDRTTIFGNPFTIEGARAAGFKGEDQQLRDICAGWFRNSMLKDLPATRTIRKRLRDLRGKNLACWCAIGSACHADILLEMANE